MAGPHIIHLGTRMHGADKRIEICHDRAMTTIWLQLTNTEYIINGSTSPQLVTVLIGAIPQGSSWVPIGPGPAARFRDVTLALGTSLASATAKFQKAIVDHWKGFSSNQAGKWAKGTTFGTSFTSASFVMKALKTGFDAIGQPMSAYSGIRTAGFTVADVLAYLGTRSAAAGATVFDGGLHEFEELGPMAPYEPPYVQDRANVSDTRVIPYIASGKPHGGRFAYETDTSGVPYKRVIAYGFRGDSRPPSAIKNAGGFLPNYTRPAHIQKNVNNSQDQALNLKTFIANQEYGGYLSVTKSIAVAKGFAIGMAGTTAPGPGWVYACFAEGGFHLLAKDKDTYKWVLYNEQEISVPGILDWDDIVGCRHVLKDGSFDGNVYLKSTLAHEDPKAAVELWELLSGASQGPGL